jgi:hypothetical protein
MEYLGRCRRHSFSHYLHSVIFQSKSKTQSKCHQEEELNVKEMMQQTLQEKMKQQEAELQEEEVQQEAEQEEEAELQEVVVLGCIFLTCRDKLLAVLELNTSSAPHPGRLHLI